MEPQETRQIVSMVMENVALFTPSALWHVVLSMVHLIEQLPEMSAMVSVA